MSNYTITTGGEQISKLSMNLFGIPYQFPPSVDPRIKNISKTIGKNYIEKIVSEAPVLTLIPGGPKYLSSEDENTRKNVTNALLEASGGSMDSLNQILNDNEGKDMKLYDFERKYTEYIQYVNVLCRAGAAFLGLTDTIEISGLGKFTFEKFDWKNYRWNTDATKSMVEKTGSAVSALKSLSKPKKKSTKGMTKKEKKAYEKKYKKQMAEYKKANKKAKAEETGSNYLTEEDQNPESIAFSLTTPDEEEASIVDEFTNYNYVQFYINPESGSGDTMSNSTGESSIKGLFSGAEQSMKDFAFMLNSGGIDANKLKDMASGTVSGLQSAVDKLVPDGGMQSIFDRVINLGDRVVRGENIVIPDIYTSSSYEKSYSVTINLKSPYGTKLGYYMNIFVPLMHLLALVLPKQGTANSYESPFLVKGYIEGMWTINLGIVTDISISKDTETLSVDGLPMSVDVTLNIRDLYSDLSISPANKPRLFINNSSLIEYLATTCGMSLTKPNLETKYKMILDTMISSFTDIPSNVKSSIDETINNFISQHLSLY